MRDGGLKTTAGSRHGTQGKIMMPIKRGYLAFSTDEYFVRLRAVKAKMKERGIDTVIVTVPSNITYLTGCTAKSGYVPQGLVIALGKEEPSFLTRRQDAPAAIGNDNVIGYSENLVGNPDKDGFDAVIAFLHDAGLATGRVALEKRFLPYEATEKFRISLPKADVADFSNVVTWLRLIKTDAEIAIMREAAAISDAAMKVAGEVIAPGVTEAHAAGEIIRTLVQGAKGIPDTDVASFFLCAIPRHMSDGHKTRSGPDRR
ncbi:aminopeptidase P family N-terminal domain-containing protein [Mesorhizobium sp. BHbdii]